MTILSSSLFWGILAGILLIIDVLLLSAIFPTILAVAFGGVAIVSLFTNSLLIILLSAIVFSLVSYFALAPYLNKVFKKETLNDSNVYTLIGKEATVKKDISPSKKGYVTINGEEWLATSNDNIHSDDVVIIKEIQGSTLIVSKKFI